MNSKSMIAVALVAVVVVALAAVLLVQGDDDGDEKDAVGPQPGSTFGAQVWMDPNDGSEPVSSEGTGTTVRELLESAFPDSGIKYRANGNIASVNGVQNTDTHVWTVFRWASPGGWVVMNDASSAYTDGMNIALRYAEKEIGDRGEVIYTEPEVEVEYRVWFFIQMLEEINSTEWLRAIPLSDVEKKHGVWISGVGETANEALADAILTYFFPDSEYEVVVSDEGGAGSISYEIDGESFFTYGTNPTLYGWFVTFLGREDLKVGSGGEYGSWLYWNQYSYSPEADAMDNPDYWEYNDFAFGMHDITKYRYFGLILKTSVAEDTQNTVDLPTPSEILQVR